LACHLVYLRIRNWEVPAKNYCRKTTRSPPRQLSAKPTRTISYCCESCEGRAKAFRASVRAGHKTTHVNRAKSSVNGTRAPFLRNSTGPADASSRKLASSSFDTPRGEFNGVFTAILFLIIAKSHAAYGHQRHLIIPGIGYMVERNLEVGHLPGLESLRRGWQKRPGFAQGDLV
jgi:hypothetical protein